jgi:MoaA/NifB/PqqE/SkfB family radical SAM enzyme
MLGFPSTAIAMEALWRTNRARLAGDLTHARTQSSGRPSHLKIELTNYCNLACPMCPHPQMKRAHGYMTESLFRAIIDQAIPELEFAYLHHLGESLFHPRLGALIGYAHHRGVPTGLSTNATFLDGRKARALLENRLDFLVISVDAASAATYDRMRTGADFHTTTRHVRDFLALRRRMRAPTSVAVQLIVTDWNRDEIDGFAAEWADSGASIMIKEARDWAGQVRLPVLGAPHARSLEPCKMPWTELTVLWDGGVVACANFYERDHLLGDLSAQSLDEVWNGPALSALRGAHLDATPVPICATCPRHPLTGDFVPISQLAQRLRTYGSESLTPRPGLS